MDALGFNPRATVDNTSQARIDMDVLFYGAPLAAGNAQLISIKVPVNSGDSVATLAARMSAAVDAEAARMTLPAPTNTIMPTYSKLK